MASEDSTPKDDKPSTPDSVKTAKDLANLNGTDKCYEDSEEGCPGRDRYQPLPRPLPLPDSDADFSV